MKIVKVQLIPDGTYQFIVINAEEKIAKSKMEYISLTLRVWDNDGVERNVFCNLYSNKLIKHFCDVTDMLDKYDNDVLLATDCVGKYGMVKIGTKLGDERFDAQNIVEDFVNKKEAVSPEADIPFDDDIKF